MKTAWFYAMRELGRRLPHFAGIYFSVGTAIFIPMTLYGYTEARRGNGFNEQFFFFFVLIAVIIFGMTVVSLADKYDKFSDDYRMLLRYGLRRHFLGIIQAIEMTVVFICSAAVFYPLSIASLAVIFRRYNTCLDEYPWIAEERFDAYSLPEKMYLPEFGWKIFVLLLLIYLVLLCAVAAAYFKSRSLESLSTDLRLKNGAVPGTEKMEKRNDLSAYSAAVSRRMKRKLKHTGKTVILSLLVPIVMLCGALTSGAVHYRADIFIMTDDLRSPIPQTVLDELERMDGIESLDVQYYDRFDGERVIGRMDIILKDENFHETAWKIDRIPGLSVFEVRFNCFSEIGTNAAYRMNRAYFSLAAGEAFVSGIVVIGFLMIDCLKLRREEMRILRRLGMMKSERVRLKVCGNISMFLPAVTFAGGLGLSVYLGMSVYGGDILHLADIALAVSVLVILTALTAVMAVVFAMHSERMEKK